ncbi:MAG: sugar phosphate isomerase/epimerase family protein [Thermoguttaceae bacterium]
MTSHFTRREFLAVSAAAGAGLAIGGHAAAETLKTKLHKAMIGVPSEDLLKAWKAAGFEGIESTQWRASSRDAAAMRKTAESLGMRVHSVLFGWGNMNRGDAALADSVAKMQIALRTAQAYGADTVLYVPCVVAGVPVPEPWLFDIRFDKKTGHLEQVVADNDPKFQKYIEAHDHAIDTSREGIKRLIPTAEKTGVVIAVENVWNNLCVKPDLAANFVASFNSPWVRAYFDIGNHVKYAPPQDWIRTLGKLVVKCHVKDFKLNPDGHGGEFCNIRDGSINWPAVRAALDRIGYNGWMSIEGGDLSLAENSKRLDLIISGR